MIPAELLKNDKNTTTYFVPKPQFATAKANMRASASQHSLNKSKRVIDLEVAKNPYIDKSSLAKRQNERPSRELKFNRQGKFVEAAENMRAEKEIEELKRKIEESARKAGLDMEVVADICDHKEAPLAEWWDEQYLPSGSYEDVEKREISFEFVKMLIQRPALIRKPGDSDEVSIPLFLTPEERKKIRRQRRLEEQKEKREKIMLGLIPEPEQKCISHLKFIVKMSTFMKVLANQAIQDPTKMEELVKQQAKKRLEEHLKANEERKLTDEEKAAKVRRKLKADLDAGHECVVFLLPKNDDFSKKIIFKIQVNAKQLWLSGCLIIHPPHSFVIVQGGKKSIKKYKKLMLQRLDLEQEEEDESHVNIVWEGQLPNREFSYFETKEFASELDIEDYLAKASPNAKIYWKLVKEYQKSLQ